MGAPQLWPDEVEVTLASHHRLTDNFFCQDRVAITAKVAYGSTKLPPTSSIAEPTSDSTSASASGGSRVSPPVVGRKSSHSSRVYVRSHTNRRRSGRPRPSATAIAS